MLRLGLGLLWLGLCGADRLLPIDAQAWLASHNKLRAREFAADMQVCLSGQPPLHSLPLPGDDLGPCSSEDGLRLGSHLSVQTQASGGQGRHGWVCVLASLGC